MKISIISFKGINECINLFIDQMVIFLKKRSINYYIADSRIPESWKNDEFFSFISQPGCIFLAFEHAGIEINLSTQNIWKKYQIPVYDYIFDHPRLLDDYFANPPCDIQYILLDKEHQKLINKFFPYAKTLFFPCGGTEIGKTLNYQNREIDVLCMSDCNTKDLRFKRIPFFSDEGRYFYSWVYNFLINNPNKTTDTAIDFFLIENNVILDHEQKYKLFFNYSNSLEIAVRNHFKLEGIKALDNIGIKVNIFGRGWQDDDYIFSDNIIRHGRVQIHELMPLIGKSKISLCFMPWFKSGCSEKNFDSMLNGAVCVSDYSNYLGNHYIDGHNIVYFDLNNPNQMAMDIKWLLEHLNMAEKIAQNGYNTAAKYDSWEKRYSEIFNLLSISS